MEINSKSFPKNFRKVVCIIILFLLIMSRFKIVDIGGNKLFIFFGPNETGYLLNHITIKTEIGTIYLERFGKVYPKPMMGFGIKYSLWYELKVKGDEIEYDLTIFGEKIKDVNFMLLDNRNYFSIFISPQNFNILNSIDENIFIDFINYDPHDRTVTLIRDQYQLFYHIKMTLDGEIIKENDYE